MPLPGYIKTESEWNFNRVSMVIQDSPVCNSKQFTYSSTKQSDSSSNILQNYDSHVIGKKREIDSGQENTTIEVNSLTNSEEFKTSPIINDPGSLNEDNMLLIVKHLQASIVNVLLRKANIQHQKHGNVWSHWEIENVKEGSVVTVEYKQTTNSELMTTSTMDSKCLNIKQEATPEMLQILSDPYVLEDSEEIERDEESTVHDEKNNIPVHWEPANNDMKNGHAPLNTKEKENQSSVNSIKTYGNKEYSEEEDDDYGDIDDDDEIKIEFIKTNDEKLARNFQSKINNQNMNGLTSANNTSKSEVEIFNCYNKYCSSPEKKGNDSVLQFCSLPQIPVIDAEKEFLCKYCNKKFHNMSSLISHERTHAGEKLYNCLYCGKDFSQLNNLEIHKQTHAGEKPYSCQACDKNFTTWGSKYLHERTHAGNRPHICKSCGKSFTQKRNLVTHERTHSGERPYPCSFCSKRFSTVSIAKAHERIHTGEKPYACQHCDKKFSHLTNLNTHERLHTGVKPYGCTLCGKRFAAYSSAKSHARVHSVDNS